MRQPAAKFGAFAAGIVATLLVAPHSASAQVVRGTVVDATQRPVAGVVVALLDSAETVVARALTIDNGEYRVVAPRSGRYRLRTLRIGYQPTTSAPYALAEGSVTLVPLTVDGVRVQLAAVTVVARSSCRRSDGPAAQSAFAIWDQAMTSIAATALTSSARGLTATTMQLERTLEPNGRRIQAQSAAMRTDYVTQPWRSLPPDTLRRRGYRETDRFNVTTYNAPGLDALIAPSFIEDHCLRVVLGRDSAEVGVAFEPTPERQQRSDIRGTLWLTRATAELRRLDFEYTNEPSTTAAARAGGQMTFTRLAQGAIVISAWDIRMPQLVQETAPRARARVRVEGISVTGGQLVVLRRGTDTLFVRPRLAVRGEVRDSVSDRRIPGATLSFVGTGTQARADSTGEFVLNDLLPGEYTLSVRTPSLDSIRAASATALVVTDPMSPLVVRVPTATQLTASICGNVLAGASGRGKGAVVGALRTSSESAERKGVRIAVDWQDAVVRSATDIQRVGKRMETTTDSSGAFRVCGVPLETALRVRAFPARGRSSINVVRLADESRFGSVEVAVDVDSVPLATLRGTVVADSTARPIADADIAIEALQLRTRSDPRGAFILSNVPAGTHELTVRRLGFGALRATITLASNEDEERRIVLRPVTVLDSVEVTAERNDPRLRDYEENRRLGLGHFLTRDELEKNAGRRLGDIMSVIPGAGVVRNRTGAFILSKRYVVSLSAISGGGETTIYRPTPIEKRQGLTAGCYAQVWVEGQLMNPGLPTEPYDINLHAPQDIEALEYYSGPSQTPSRYERLNSTCGVVVIHLRRNR
ncbi:MAG: carboxypeptidase regulatory-like domain-containing protein [Gemmatimonadaceae bacterium]|nr:carboxypeptidase regulatory-like domain-containing protein [Gemmatimonadaceae bacterium]